MYLTPETLSIPPGLGSAARASATSRPPGRVMGKRITRHRIGTSAARSSATARAVVSAVFMSCTLVMPKRAGHRSEEHTSELQSRLHLVCRLLLEKKKKKNRTITAAYT